MKIQRQYGLLLIAAILVILVSALVAWGYHLPGVNRVVRNVAEDKEGRATTLLVTGDVMLGRYVNTKATQMRDFSWSWKQMADLFRQADLTLINLESPLIDACPLTESGMKFCGDVQHVSGLQSAGIDLASLANNHAENYGVRGLEQTAQALTAAGIKSIGIGEPQILERNDIRFAFLAYNDAGPRNQTKVASAQEETITSDIQRVKSQSDVVVVMFHWGNEYTHKPTIRQQHLAHLAIDAGADLVLGNHPHWVQPKEIYNDKTILYSHGNFIFDQNWSKKTSQGLVGKYTFRDSQLVQVELIPIVIEHNGQPRLANTKESEEILKSINP